MSFGTFLACFVVLMLGHGQTCTSSMADHQNKFHGLLSGALGMSISNQEEFPQNKLVSAHESVLSSCMRLRGGGPPQSSNKPKKKRKAKSKRKTLKLKYKIKKKVTEVGPLFFDKTKGIVDSLYLLMTFPSSCLIIIPRRYRFESTWLL